MTHIFYIVGILGVVPEVGGGGLAGRHDASALGERERERGETEWMMTTPTPLGRKIL